MIPDFSQLDNTKWKLTALFVVVCLAIFASGFFAPRIPMVGTDIGGVTIDSKTQATLDSLPSDIKDTATDLVKEELTYFKANEKYKTVTTTKDILTGYEYWIDEYVAPPYNKDSKGYQFNIKRSDGMVKSFGLGAEAEKRTHDWKSISEPK